MEQVRRTPLLRQQSFERAVRVLKHGFVHFVQMAVLRRKPERRARSGAKLGSSNLGEPDATVKRNRLPLEETGRNQALASLERGLADVTAGRVKALAEYERERGL